MQGPWEPLKPPERAKSATSHGGPPAIGGKVGFSSWFLIGFLHRGLDTTPTLSSARFTLARGGEERRRRMCCESDRKRERVEKANHSTPRTPTDQKTARPAPSPPVAVRGLIAVHHLVLRPGVLLLFAAISRAFSASEWELELHTAGFASSSDMCGRTGSRR